MISISYLYNNVELPFDDNTSSDAHSPYACESWDDKWTWSHYLVHPLHKMSYNQTGKMGQE